MPNIKSNAKRMITSNEARLRNKSKKSKIKTMTKKYEALIAAKDKEGAAKFLPLLISEIDKSKIFKANNASRKAARFSKLLSDLK